IEQPNKKRDYISPPREGIASPNGKKGKTVDRAEPHRHSPQGLTMMARQGQSTSRGYQADHYSRSPTPTHHDDSPAQKSQESDEVDPRCPLTRDILRASIP
ncbi:hypothetical protein L195_g062381, partial [Trifolium pratense]